MSSTPTQQLSRVLLRAFFISHHEGNAEVLRAPYVKLSNEVDPLDYNICLAWASEQWQLWKENHRYLPLGEEWVERPPGIEPG